VAEAPRPTGSHLFPETHWSQVLELGDAADPLHVEHLNRLVERYWKPTYHYLRAMRPLDRADAEDLTQGFFTMLLSRVDFSKLSPERGSFRGFLKTALRRFVIDQERSAAARTGRGAGGRLAFHEAEALMPPAPDLSPDEAFDRAWARDVVDQAIARLEQELEAEGKSLYFQVFKAYRLDGDDEVSYADVAERHGLKETDVRNYLRLAHQRGRAIIESLVGEYLLPGESLADELRFILAR
jgi:RNA polymerase sigma-70 factor (ECF subfamily)